MAVASLVLGILTLITCFIPVVGLVLSVIALVISIIAICIKKSNEEGKGLKVAGLILSIIAFLVSLVISAGVIMGVIYLVDNKEQIKDEIQDGLQQIVSEAEVAFAENILTLTYVNTIYENSDGVAYNSDGNIMTAEDYKEVLIESGIQVDKFEIIVDELGKPSLQVK